VHKNTPAGAAKAAGFSVHRRRSTARRAVRGLWKWLTGTAYRPELHYMRGEADLTHPRRICTGPKSAAGRPLSLEEALT